MIDKKRIKGRIALLMASLMLVNAAPVHAAASGVDPAVIVSEQDETIMDETEIQNKEIREENKEEEAFSEIDAEDENIENANEISLQTLSQETASTGNAEMLMGEGSDFQVTFSLDAVTSGVYATETGGSHPAGDYTVDRTYILRYSSADFSIANQATGLTPAKLRKLDGSSNSSFRWSSKTEKTAADLENAGFKVSRESLEEAGYSCDEDSTDFYYIYIHDTTRETLRFAILIEITPNGTVSERSLLGNEISKVTGDAADNWYHENDRYNGRVVSEKGFWADMEISLQKAQKLYENTSASLSDIKSAYTELQEKVANLIPISQINATEVYEAAKQDHYWWGPQLTTDGTIPGVSKVTESNASRPSFERYKKAKEACNALLARFYQDGVATADNNSANQEIADEMTALLEEYQYAVAELDPTADYASSGSGDQAVYSYDCMQVYLNDMFSRDKIDASKYTEESYQAYESAYTLAETFCLENGRPNSKTVGWKERIQYIDTYNTLRNACYGLVPVQKEVTATLTILDLRYMMKQNCMPNGYHNEITVQAGTSLADAVNTYYPEKNNHGYEDVHWWHPMINGVFYPNLDWRMRGGDLQEYVIKDGDEIVLAYAETPYDVSMIGLHEPMELKDAIINAYCVTLQVETEAVSLGEAVIIHAEKAPSFPTTINGAAKAFAGGEIYRSDCYETREGLVTAIATKNTGVKTDAAGNASVELSETGWYLFYVVDSSRFGGATFGSPLIVEVTETKDLSGYKDAKAEQLKIAYEAYPQYFYSSQQWQTVVEKYNSAMEQIKKAAESKAVNLAFTDAYDTITGYQKENEETYTSNVAYIRHCLKCLPTQKDLEVGRLYSMDQVLLDYLFEENALYDSLNQYQNEMLTENELHMLALLKKAYTDSDNGRSLPETPVFKVTFQCVDTQTGETFDPALINLSLTHPAANSGDNRSYIYTYIETALDAGVIKAKDWQYLNKRYVSMGEDYTIDLATDEPGYDSMVYLRMCAGLKADTGYDVQSVACDSESQYQHSLFAFSEGRYKEIDVFWDHSPRKDVTVTIYCKGPNEVDDTRDAALEEIKSVYDGMDKTLYTVSDWRQVILCYEAGVNAIHAAGSAADIQTSKAEAIDRMRAVEKKEAPEEKCIEGWTEEDAFDAGCQVGTVTVWLENTTYDNGSWLYSDGNPENAILYREDFAIGENDTMMTALLRAMAEEGYSWNGTGGSDYGITYLSEIEASGERLGEFDGGDGSGWMGTLNDWFTNLSFSEFSVENGKLRSGDLIHIQYTCDMGSDLSGSWDDITTTLSAMEIIGGELVEAFSPGNSGRENPYTLYIEEEEAVVRIKPLASNRNYLTKIFLNEKVLDNQEGGSFYGWNQEIPVKAGDKIYVGCGEYKWPSMNNQEGNTAMYAGTWYVLTVEKRSSQGPGGTDQPGEGGENPEEEAFAIISQPSDTNVLTGETVSYSVKATAAESYQWYYSKDGQKWYKSTVSSSITDTISLKVSATNLANSYKCKLTGKDGTVLWSDTARNIAADTALVITAQPVNHNLENGKTITFTVKAMNAVSYQWYYSKDHGKHWYKTSLKAAENEGKTESSITMKASATNVNNVYRCKITGKDGSVTATETVGILNAPVITEQPVDQTGKAGDSITYSLKADNALSYQWYYSKDGQNWYKSSISTAKTDTLTFKAAKTNLGNQYKCSVTGKQGIVLWTDIVQITAN